jgi:hypothetical protein
MGGFAFGVILQIDISVATVAFVSTICFLLLFEFLTGALEYFFEEKAIHLKILQKIYKELMIMGFVSLALTLYNASSPHSASINDKIVIFDIVHYIIFFICIFFVMHALYIMVLSIFSAKTYESLHSMPTSEVIQRIVNTESSWLSRFAFKYLPFNSLARTIEFKVIYVLFRETYNLPRSFDYGAYLSGCFERYALKVLNMGVWSWVVLCVLAVANFVRTKVDGDTNYSCEASSYHYGEEDDTPNVHRMLSESSTEEVSRECVLMSIKYFAVCAAGLCIYIFVLYVVGRIYERKLIAKAGVTKHEDYGAFIIFQESFELRVS